MKLKRKIKNLIKSLQAKNHACESLKSMKIWFACSKQKTRLQMIAEIEAFIDSQDINSNNLELVEEAQDYLLLSTLQIKKIYDKIISIK